MTEVTAIAKTNGHIHLTPDEVNLVVSQFAKGSPRGEVCKILIKESDRHPYGDTEYTRKLSGYLRKYDPKSSGFSQKYAEILSIHRDQLREELGEYYKEEVSQLQERLLARVVGISEQISSIDERIRMLTDLWQDAHRQTQIPMTNEWTGSVKFNTTQHQRLIDLDKQLQQWYKIRLKEEEYLANLFFALKKYEMAVLDQIQDVAKAHTTAP